MKYFKNTELAELYKVSEKSVRNWVTAAQAGKIDLQLYEKNDKFFVANSTKNTTVIESLVQKGKKYKNTRGHKLIVPSPRFYELYNPKQIFEIISSLNVHKELPLQYNYFAEGASDFDAYTQRLADEKASNMLNTCKELLETNLDSLDRLISDRSRVNLIDLGIGNCMPVKGLVEHLIKQGKLNRYIGIDISKSMLRIAERNMREWFDNRGRFEFYERDMSREGFDDLIGKDYFVSGEEAPVNIVLLLGGTLENFEVPSDVLRIVNKSIQPDDLFIFSLKLDTPNSRRYFDLHPDPTNMRQMATWQKGVLDLLNIDESLYEAEQVFDPVKKARFVRAKLKFDLSIKFNVNKGDYTIDLNKGDSILLLRYWHQDASDVMRQFHQNGFDTLQTSKSRDQEYFLLIAEVAHDFNDPRSSRGSAPEDVCPQ